MRILVRYGETVLEVDEGDGPINDKVKLKYSDQATIVHETIKIMAEQVIRINSN